MARSRHFAARCARDGCGTLIGRLLGMGQSYHTPSPPGAVSSVSQ
jgi:hypothetical protein